MAARLARRWEWSVEDDGYDQVADAAGLVLAFSPNTGVVALRVADGRAELAWRHPRPAGEWIELVGAVGGPGRSQVFVAYQQAWSAPVLRSLSAADGVAAWERELGRDRLREKGLVRRPEELRAAQHVQVAAHQGRPLPFRSVIIMSND
jgi:hypothetical protein